MRNLISAIIVLFFLSSGILSAQTTIISATDNFKYLDNGTNQGTAWRTLPFNDSTWPQGNAELGCDDNPQTSMNCGKITYYFRKKITIPNPSDYSGFTMKVRRDDGIVVYINGNEVYRNNMPSGTISYTTVASSTCSDDGDAVFTIQLPVSTFSAGDNLVAAEVHNRKVSSSDITFELQLTGMPAQTSSGCAVPSASLFGTRNKTATSAEPYWRAVSGATTYNIRYRIENTGSYMVVNTNNTYAVLNGLQPSTKYEFNVQSVCNGGTSAYSSRGVFWTLAGSVSTSCGIPNVNYFGTRNKTSSSAEPYWKSITGATSYNVSYRVRNVGAAYSAPVNTQNTYFVINNLQPSTNYEFIVQAVCGSALSAFSPSGWFTTTAGSNPPPAPTTLTRNPYITVATSSSVTIQWRTSTSTSSEVRYGTSASSLTMAESDNTLSTNHSIELTGLQPNTKYYYSVGQAGSVLQSGSSNFFYTAPSNGSSTPVRFWVTGDFGNGSSAQAAVRDAFVNYNGSTKLNGWLWLGDNAYSNGTDSEYQSKVFNVYTSLLKNTPLFPAPGNHDYAQSGYLSSAARSHNFPYFSIFDIPTNSGTEKYYSTNYGNIHFIALDSYGSYNNTSSPMYNWLQADLAANQQMWTVVYFHHPPYSKGSHNSDSSQELVDMRNNIIPLLEAHGVDLVLSGHSHAYERTMFIKGHYGNESSFSSSHIVQPGAGPYSKTSLRGPGTIYAVCGVSGERDDEQASGWPHNAMYYASTNHYGSIILDVAGGMLKGTFLTSTGIIKDQFTINKSVSSSARLAPEVIDVVSSNTMNVYPNPTHDEINLQFDLKEEEKLNIRVHTIEGKLVYETESMINANNTLIKLNTAEFSESSAGMYMLTVKGNNSLFSERIILQ